MVPQQHSKCEKRTLVKAPVTPPRPPEPSDFEPTTATINDLPKTYFVHFFDEQKRQHKRSGIFIVCWLLSSTLILLTIGSRGFFVAFISAIPLLLLIYIFGRVEQYLRIVLNTNYRRYEKYQEAIQRYKIDLAIYDAELLKLKEDYWRALSGMEFELELSTLFRKAGYYVDSTGRTGDGGVDIMLKKDGRLTVVQCKAHRTKVPINVVRELYASMMDFGAQSGIIASFEGLTKPAADYVKTRSIASLTLREIINMQTNHSNVVALSGACVSDYISTFEIPKLANSPTDKPIAFSAYGEAAERGNAEAQFYLAEVYSDGDGLTQSNADAVSWWRKAAEQGHSAAQYQLGLACWKGRGTPKNLIAAHMWFSLSWNEIVLLPPRVFYSPGADEMRNEVQQGMSRKEVAEAQRLAREWSNKIVSKTEN